MNEKQMELIDAFEGVYVSAAEAGLLIENYEQKIRDLNRKIEHLLNEKDALEVRTVDLKRRLNMFRKLRKENNSIGSTWSIKTFLSQSTELEYKWRDEIVRFFENTKNEANAAVIASTIIDRDKIKDDVIQKEIKTKISMGLSAMFRDEKVIRERKSSDDGYVYRLIK